MLHLYLLKKKNKGYIFLRKKRVLLFINRFLNKQRKKRKYNYFSKKSQLWLNS